ncbi:MAG: TonB-dependent receptor [Tannerella sp.]|nr:TonB-dependent receptor [Tannerella sp.]
MKLRNIIILCAVCLFPFWATAQQIFKMGGMIYDEENQPAPGAVVYLKNKANMGTITDANGTFKLEAYKGDIIVVSLMGYDNFEYLVEKEDSNIVVKLAVASNVIDEVVVTGLGSQRKISVVGAITSVNVDEIQTPATSLSNMLGGRVPGVISMMTSGEPGKNIAEFWIRGIGTFGASTSALVLIDGLEGDLNSVDPADVESFSILKDASATAVYGVRGANGVVLITTKRGVSGKLKITARANFTMSRLVRMPEYLHSYDYARLANEAKEVRNNEPLYSNLELKFLQYHLDNDLYPDVDWQNEILNRNGYQQTYYVSGQGGGDIARYFISLGLSNESAAYKMAPDNVNRTGVGYNTYNYRTNLDINMTASTRLRFGVDGYLTYRKQPGLANTDYLWEAQSMLTPITIPTIYSTGHIPAYGAAEATMSPYVLLNHTGSRSEQTYTGKLSLELLQDFSFLLKGLNLRIQGAYDNKSYFNESRRVQPEMYMATGRDVNGKLLLAKRVEALSAQYSYNMRLYRKYHLESTLTWEKIIEEDHRVSVLAYYLMNDQKDTYDIDNAGIVGRSMAAIPKRYQGLSSRITYGYKDTYMIDGNFGYTGSENFEPGKQFGFFPSVAAGWIPTNYDLIKEHLPWLNFLKIRGSYGIVGNDRIASFRFPYLTTVSENVGTGWAGTGADGISGVTELQFGANNLMWEKALKADLGIESRLLDERLSFTVDFFNDRRDGIFQRREFIPSYVGLIYSARPYGNVGQMRSFGSDGNIAYIQEINKDWSFTIRANYTYSQNEVINWEQTPAKYPYQLYNGYPTNRIQGYIALGLFRDEQDVTSSPVQTFGGEKVMPGDIKYKDINGDGVINSDDRVFLSDPTFPRLMYGFGGEVNYKDFTLGILFKGTGKTDFYHVGYYHSSYGTNGAGYVPFNNGETGNVLSIVNDPSNRWIPMDYALAHGIDPALAENPNARFPRLTYGYNANNSQLSTWWKGDSRYLRLQEITLKYHVQQDFLHKAGLSSADIQFVGANLYVWDKVGLWDPEQAFRNGRAYPIPARYTIQLYLNF